MLFDGVAMIVSSMGVRRSRYCCTLVGVLTVQLLLGLRFKVVAECAMLGVGVPGNYNVYACRCRSARVCNLL